MTVKYDPILDALREADTSGSSDTASNLGSGIGVYSYKNSGVFYFNSLSGSSTIGLSGPSSGVLTFDLINIPSGLIPDPLNVNNLNVYSTASINRLHVNNIDFSLTGGSTTPLEGEMNWNSSLGYLQYGLPGGNVELAIGMEQVLPRRCKNTSGTTMTKGTVVYISSVSGNDPVVSRALATSDATSAFTIGVCAEDIPDGQKGWICTFGVISGLNLSSYSAGDTVYLSGTTAGAFTNVKPYAPVHYVRVGIVTKATASGDLVVNVINGFEMQELHNVSAQSAASGDILRYNTSTSLWEKTGLVTPQTKALISGQFLDSYDSTTGLFTSSVFNSANATHNNLSGLQGGTAGEYYHLTNAQVTNLNNQSGTNTGDETKTSIETKLGAATSSNNGYLTSTDWSTFNGKLTPNAPITGATKTKITYDANGLVTAGADATTADIADSTNKRYVTDADLTKLSNTSGTNTGDITVTDSSTIDFTLTGQALTGSVIQGGISHNNLGSIQGGVAGQYYHLTAGELTTVQATTGTNTGDQVMPVYGDGADASVSFDGFTSYPHFSTNDGLGTYTLTRDVFATDIYVASGITVITAGYRLFANNYINNDGTIHNNGGNASGTTAGAGGLGGFFKAGGTGATGLLAASAGANGTAQATPTANTLVGGVGGKGGQGRATITTFNGGQITTANITAPANADGGSKVTSNYVNYLTRYIVGATNWQMTPSIGGGSGAKSIIGTTATSGGGGGGGGVCFVAAPLIQGMGQIMANGGAGGNAAGTGGSFGGGGGGGGGIACVIAKTSLINATATGGNGGTSIFGTNGTLPVATANGTTTSTTDTMTLSPTTALSKGRLYLITFHLQNAAGIGTSGINSIEGYGISWQAIGGSRIDFNTIATPVRGQETWYGYYRGDEPDLIEDDNLTVYLSQANTAARVIIDEISNVDCDLFTNPLTGNTSSNVTNAALTLTVTLPFPPTTGNLVYSVFSRTVATGLAAGAGNTLVNSQTTAPILASQVSNAQQANAQTHTTTNGAIAGYSIEITATASGTNGSNGWDGKVVRIYG